MLTRRPFAYRLLCVISICIVTILWTITPARAFFKDFGIKDEQELGRKFDVMVRTRLPLIEDPEIKGYIRSIVEKLVDAAPPQPFTFTANVLLHNSINAFAVPGGFVFVNSGLIMNVEHESELAGVMAHEISHVTQRHIASRIDRSRFTTIASLAGALFGAALGGSGGGALASGSIAAGQTALLNYSRQDETEADQIGLQYLVKAGYRPQGMVGAFNIIRKEQWESGMFLPEYLSTHPDVGSRINELSARIEGLPAAIKNRPENDTRFLRVKTLLWARYGDIETATHHFRAASPQRPLELMGQAMLHARRNRITDATKTFDAAIAASPKDPLIQREAGIFFYTIGNTRAAALLQRALQLDPKDGMAQFYYARLLDDNGKQRESQAYFRTLLKTYPDDSEIHYTYGRSLGSSGHTFLAYLHLTYSAMYQNDKRKTEDWLRKARPLAKTPQDKAALQKLEDIYAERKSVAGK